MVPSAGGTGAVRTARRLNAPSRALVEARAGGITARVKRPGVPVVREEWRIVARWWTEEPVTRRYFDLVLESGQRVVVFHDGDRGTWFTQRGV